MASINFPDPAAQTPINTFSPTSSPLATLNGLTYEWSNGSWSIIDNESVTAAPNLQKVTDIGNETTADLITGGAITAETIDGNVVATQFDIEQGTANDKVITPATLAAALNADPNNNLGINKVAFHNWKHNVRKGLCFDAVWEDDETLVCASFDTSSASAYLHVVAYKPRLDVIEELKTPFPSLSIDVKDDTGDYRAKRIHTPKIDRNPVTNTYCVVYKKATTGNLQIQRCVDPLNIVSNVVTGDNAWTQVIDSTITALGGISDIKYIGNDTWITGATGALLGTSPRGLVSTDDGLTWTSVNNGAEDYFMPFGIFNISSNGNTLLGDMAGVEFDSTVPSTDRYNKFHISTNNGKSWSQLDTNQTNNNAKYVMGAIISDEGTILYSSQYIQDFTYRSTDNGQSWAKVYIPGQQQAGYQFSKDELGNLFCYQTQMYFDDDLATNPDLTTYIDEHSPFIFKSEDDGLTWEPIGKGVQWNGPRYSTFACMWINPAGDINITATNSYQAYGKYGQTATSTNYIKNIQHALSVSTTAYSMKESLLLNGVIPFFYGHYNAVPKDGFAIT